MPDSLSPSATDKHLSRRRFVRNTGFAAASAAAFPHIASGEPNKSPLKLGLVGCGGRGRGAANQALAADKDVTLSAVADVFEAQTKAAKLAKEKGLSPQAAARRHIATRARDS